MDGFISTIALIKEIAKYAVEIAIHYS